MSFRSSIAYCCLYAPIFCELASSDGTVALINSNCMPNQNRPYEPLTSENAALVLVDHQVGLMTGVRDYSTGELKHNVVAVAKAAKALQLPIVVTTTAREAACGVRLFRNSSTRCLAFRSSIAPRSTPSTIPRSPRLSTRPAARN